MPLVKNGIDNISKYSHLFEGRRVGLVTGPTGVDISLTSSIEIFRKNYNLCALYSPEHGVRGDMQAGMNIPSYIDELTGVTVHSIYGDQRRPTFDMIKDVDIIAMDMQDIGSRYYTFIYTMANVMQECAQYGKPFVLMDRINPISGVEIEGNILDISFSSFIGLYPIIQRHGLTMGELANLFNLEYAIGCELYVVPLEGWNREMYFDDTGLLWINPSPNISSFDAALLYNGTCLFEGTNISEGRGTAKPFEYIGAPWLDAYRLADRMNDMECKGVIFRPVYFIPTFSKHTGNVCRGVQIHVTDKRRVSPVEIGIRLLFEIKKMSGDKFLWVSPNHEEGEYAIDLLAGTDELRQENVKTEKLLEKWKSECEKFKAFKEKYHIYA